MKVQVSFLTKTGGTCTGDTEDETRYDVEIRSCHSFTAKICLACFGILCPVRSPLSHRSARVVTSGPKPSFVCPWKLHALGF